MGLLDPGHGQLGRQARIELDHVHAHRGLPTNRGPDLCRRPGDLRETPELGLVIESLKASERGIVR